MLRHNDYDKCWYFYEFNDGKLRAIPLRVVVALYLNTKFNADLDCDTSEMVDVISRAFPHVNSLIEYAKTLPYDKIKKHEVVIRSDLPIRPTFSWESPADCYSQIIYPASSSE